LTKGVQTIKILFIFHQILTKLQVSELRHFCPYTIVASICHSIFTIYTNVYVGRGYSIRTSYPTSPRISLPAFFGLRKT